MKYTAFMFAAALLVASCSSESSTDSNATTSGDSTTTAQPVVTPSEISNPNSANPETAVDPATAPIMKFDAIAHDFGKIKQGDKVTHVFKFTNTGKSDLIVTDAQASCGCTVPEYPKAPIAPGKTGEIKVVFDSAGKSGKQSKTVTVTANTVPAQNLLTITTDINAPK